MQHLDGDNDPFHDFAAMTAQAPGFMIAFDRERRIRWCNRWSYGHNNDNTLGQKVEHLIHPDDRPAWVHAVRTALSEGTTTEVITRAATLDDGPAVRMLNRIGPYRRGVEIVGALVISWDVTFSAQVQPLAAFLLTPRCRKIVEFLHQNGPQKGVVIGRHLGELSGDRRQASSKVRATLAGLEERGILRQTPEGYGVTPEFISAYVATPPHN